MNVNNLDMICALIINKKKNISSLVLQKLLYFIQAYSLVKNDKAAFQNRMEAWMYGPVVPEVYQTFKANKDYYENINFSQLDEEIKEVVEIVVDNLGNLDPFYLVNKTHEYEPWINAWSKPVANNEITIEAIKKYHNTRLKEEGSAF